MTQNEKDLLLKDLCARLPYGVKGLVTFNGNIFMTQPQVEDRTIDGKLYDRFAEFQSSWYDNITIKPYLFPLSSMTEEQKEEFNSYVLFDGIQLSWESFDGVMLSDIEAFIDFFHKNHIDYRGLIEKGLAIDATGLNIY